MDMDIDMDMDIIDETRYSDFNRNENPNWQYIGKLQNLNVFSEDNKLYTLVKTNKTFFVIEGMIKQPVHIGQTVKLSKRDNAAKIGALLVLRPIEHVTEQTIEFAEENID